MGRLSLLLFLVPVSFISHVSSTPSFVGKYCPNTTLFQATDSAYLSNINSLLSKLSAAANSSSTPGFNYISNITTSSAPAVYGLYLCRGDDDPATCRDCVATASGQLARDCPLGKEAVIWYDRCMIRYSNQSFFSELDANLELLLYNTHNVTTNITGFNEVLSTTLAKVVQEAGGGSVVKFSTEQAQFAAFQNVYALGQCTPDLSTADCTQCLQQCSTQLSSWTRQGGRILYFSCNLRYEIYPFYQNIAASVSGSGGKKSSSKVVIQITVGAASAVVLLLLLAAAIFLVIRRRDKKQANASVADSSANDDFSAADSLQYPFETLEAATNNFSDENKIGEGGFGTVYKGTLPNGQQVAVKRLLRSSGHAAQELKNEVRIVAKLHHRNLVRLLGFCLAEDDKLFVYEFVPNGSLDSFLFDPERQQQLDWSIHYKIISGIARGMLYLHEESQVRIIHRDLKASNVLLDADMAPKISDFGMARIFGEDETHDNTTRVVGTYGYMSPEYAMHGQFLVKSDVYSFGVLILEIISCKRNNNFYASGYAEDLLQYAWKLRSEGRSMEFVDALLRNSCPTNEVMRCIHIGLLCVQDDIDQRPTMASVVLMLNSYSMSLSTPLQPSFFTRNNTNPNVLSNKPTNKSAPVSVNEHFDHQT